MKSIDATGYDTDKSRGFLRSYERHFAGLGGKADLLELGIFRGGSLLLWRDHFEQGVVCGLDIDEVKVPDTSGRIRVYQGRQEDTALLDRIGAEAGPFDIIIDDASHVAEPTRVSFWHLFDRHLRPGGIYVIEDWRVGYWSGWPDGERMGITPARGLFSGKPDPRRFPSHDFGLVGFVKQLVDEMGADAYTHPSRGSTEPHRVPKFAGIEILPGQVFITKATPEDDVVVREGWAKA